MKKTVIFALFLFVTASLCAELRTVDLLNAYDNCHILELEVAEINRLRRDALIDFFEKHAGKEYVSKNTASIENMAVKGNIKTLVDKILESYHPDKKARAKIVAGLTLPGLNNYKVNQLHTSLQNIIEPLRGPLADGYRFAHYSRQNGVSVEKHKLVAKHAVGTWQTFERTYEKRIYKIRLFSPTKFDLFNNNRDVFLDRLVVEYNANGENKKAEQTYQRLLKRGESIEFNLPEIARQATVRLTYATEAQHRNKAYFYVEPVAAALVDNPDSPFLNLINNIGRQNYRNESLENVSTAIQTLKNDLRHAILENEKFRQVPAASGTTAGQNPASPDGDKLRYFLYMIKDETISRENLAEKFSEMFRN